ncbi:MAG: 2-oxoglutarate ferredoxin oxidoreductase subunit alpha [Woeseiaceae bacterium]|jgi:2-oxoglutarate ferredoxin oxidoreductase subunit alpha|tara:strand:+ start:37765 stop:39573 length:1809 start_codon:yes stop_codon:yes gene_type:complete
MKSLSRVNDLVIKIATVNGTGSASANGLLMKSIFRMGIPVVGKNYFPSNIQGLPTWYEIRVTGDGYQSASNQIDIIVAMNAQTYQKDLSTVEPGGWLIYDSTWPRSKLLDREDITVIGIPFSKLCNEKFDGVRSRILMKNIAYVGTLVALLKIDLNIIKELLNETFATKKHLAASNLEAIMLGYDFVVNNFSYPLPLTVKALNKTKNHVIIDGNTAAGLGCVYAGATVGAWYPITPSTSLMDAFQAFCQQHRQCKKTQKNNFCIIQAEDELAAIGMVLGASWNGARAFTPTSGPGISLMSEFIGFAYYSELPAVIFDIQRTGPSTGMPTRTQQCDLMICAFASHGDTKHPLLFPTNPEECFYMTLAAFDLADELQTPIFVMSDLDIGMNDWVCPDLQWDKNYQPKRGKLLNAEQLDAMDKFYRYLDVDGDGITYRTLPGEHAKGSFFTRGSGHNKFGGYTEDSQEYQDVVDRLLIKWETARKMMPEPVISYSKSNTKAILSYGSSHGACEEALNQLQHQGKNYNYCCIKSFPFGEAIKEFINKHEIIFLVEQNRDAQLRSLLVLDLEVNPAKIKSVLHYNGNPIYANFISEEIIKNEKSDVA